MIKEGQIEGIKFEPEKGEDYKEADERKLIKLGITPDDIEKLENPEKGGASSMVYFIEKEGKKMVVKKGVDTDPNEKSAREYVILRLLAQRAGKKVSPSPYYHNANKDLIITERIEGEPVKELSTDDLEKIASALAAVHQPEFNRFGLPFQKRKEGNQYERLVEQTDFLNNWFLEMAPLIKQRGEEFYLALEKIKDALLLKAEEAKDYFQDNSFSLIHYDLNPSNIIKDKEGNILFLDWRQASIGDRAADIAKLFYKNYLDEDQRKTFFNSYSQTINDSNIKQRVEVYYPLIRLGSILWRLRFLNVDSKKHPQLLKNTDSKLIESRLDDDYNYLLSIINTK